MTALLGGSVLLIAVSSAALVYGWLNGEDAFIWTSIAATAAAFVLVVVAYIRSSKEPAVVSGRPGELGPGPAREEAPTEARQPAATEDESTQAQPAQPKDESTQAQPAATEDESTQAQPPAATEDESTQAQPAQPKDDESKP